MNKTVEDALNELIEFYSITDINDLQYLKKLFVRNLKDVRRRWIKYDKPIREDYLKQNRQIIKAIEFIEENMYSSYEQTVEKCIEETVFERSANPKELLNILQDKEVSE